MIVTVLPSVAAIPWETWSRLEDRGRLFESRQWLLANERNIVGEPLVTAQVDDRGPRSVIVWRTTEADNASPYHNILRLLRRFEALDDAPRTGWTLNCTAAGMHSPVLCAPGEVVTAETLQAHIRAVTDARAGEPDAIGFPFLPPSSAPPGLPEALDASGFQRLDGYTRGVLQLPGNDFDDYLAALSQRRRKHVRADRRQFAASRQCTSVSYGTSAAGEDLLTLQGMNLAKYDLPFDPEPQRARIATLLETFGDDAIVLRTHAREQVTGFALYFRYGTALHGLTCGFDPAVARTGAYFECVFYAAMEWAYSHGVREIDFGLSATERTLRTKELRGCSIEATTSWYRFGASDSARRRPDDYDDPS